MEFINAAIYVIIGLSGAWLHWAKKKHVDHTTNAGFFRYISASESFPATIYALAGIIFAEVNLSLLQQGEWISVAEFMGAATLGYSIDSGVNKAPDAKEIEVTK
jgi:hypothetical protein